MGLEVFVARPGATCPLDALVATLAARGVVATVMMVDNQLCMPGAPIRADWSDARLRTAAGTVTLRRRPDGVALLVFGNADPALQEAQRQIAAALASD